MYCNHCGTTLLPQQNVCPSCGQMQPTAQAQSRLASHVHLLGIFWIVIGALSGIGALVLLAIGSMAGAFMHVPDVPPQACCPRRRVKNTNESRSPHRSYVARLTRKKA